MVRRNSKTVFWLIVLALIALVYAKAFTQDSAVEVYMGSKVSQDAGYYESDDARQDSTVFWLCREIDLLHETIVANEAARREDDREMRAQLWKLALIVGGGGAVGGAGSAVVVKRRRSK